MKDFTTRWPAGPLLLLFFLQCAPSLHAQSELKLSLRDAVEIALSEEGHARVQLVQELVRQADAQADQTRALLLPHLEASVGQQSITRNLEALGLQPTGAFRPPAFVGPFSVFDARASIRQTVFDFSSIRRVQAARTGVRAVEAEKDSTEDRVAAEVARLYFDALRAQAGRDAAGANLELAEALLELAGDRRRAGTGTGLEVARAEAQRAEERQRLLEADFQVRRSRLRLAKSIGLNLNLDLVLVDRLAYLPLESPPLDDAIRIAFDQRSDLRAQEEKEERARLEYKAAGMERFPSLVAFADYGSIGSRIGDSLPTRTVGVTLQLPLFDGGQIDARRAQESSKFREEQIKTEDLRRQVELEVRLAFAEVHLTHESVQVAEETLQLAEKELAHARRRYEAGIGAGLETAEAQTRIERARDGYISALFNLNLARINLGEAMGSVRDILP